MSAYTRSRSGKIVPQRPELAVRHLGIIAQRCLFWYKSLPNHVKISYDVEDMIGDVVLHVIKRAHFHDVARGKESTFVWHTADNCCMSILQHHSTKQYSVCQTLELTNDVMRTVHGFPNPDTDQDFCISLNAVERVIEKASDALLNLIDQIFAGTVDPQRFRTSNTHVDDTLEEFKKVAASQSATLDDFIRVYKYVRC